MTPRNEIPTTIPTFSGSRISKTPLGKGKYEFQDGGRQTGDIYPDSYTKCAKHIKAYKILLNTIPTAIPCFWHQELNWASSDLALCIRKSEIQDGER